ncbi:MAG: hypothetical protein KC733_04780 [Candidatus Omnitrophica bacterium]|nr:hypothetical protein [Candidatus Omnitrophota bacterium]
MKKGYLGLEITSSKIRYTYCVNHRQGYRILKAGTSEFILDVSAEGVLTEKVLDIIKKEDLSPEKIFVTISRKDTLVRQILLPTMKAKEYAEAIPAEIEKVPTFANRKFEYIYKKYPAAQGKSRVVFAAMDEKVLSYILREVEMAGISFQHIELAPLNLKELLISNGQAEKAHGIFIVNDRVSYFVIAQNHEYKLFYQMAIGLDQLYPQNDQNLDDKVYANLISELKRVLKSYSTEHKQIILEKVLLIWDQSVGGNLQELITKDLELNIEIPSVYQLTRSEEQNVAENSIYLLALTPILYEQVKAKPQYEFNHFFTDFHLKRNCIQAALVSLLFIVIFGGGLGYVSFNFHTMSMNLKAKSKEIVKQIKEVKAESKDLYQKKEEYMEVREGLLAQATYVRELNRVPWTMVLSVVAQEMPEKLALTSFRFSEQGSANFKGESLDMESISELIRRVDDATILSGGKFDFLREKIIDKDKDSKIYNFGIMAQLKKNINDNELKEDAHETPRN